jgi:hypothetical protein
MFMFTFTGTLFGFLTLSRPVDPRILVLYRGNLPVELGLLDGW